MATTATLSLGTRQDAKYWSQECASQLHFASAVKVTEPSPSLSQIRDFFSKSNDWLFFGGHFTQADHLYNEGGTIKIRFKSGGVTVIHGTQTADLNKGDGFKQHAVKAIFWGGCNVHSYPAIVSDLRALFGNPLMIGWRDVTGWEVLYSVMGGYGNAAPHSSKDFFDRVKSDPSNETKIRTAWLDTADDTQWGATKPRFSAIGSNGDEYDLQTADGGIGV